MAFYEAVDADGHPRLFGCRFDRDELEQAKRKADRLRGYVTHGWQVVYCSPAYLKAHPLGGGGTAAGGMERVNPPPSLWTDQGRPDWVQT